RERTMLSGFLAIICTLAVPAVGSMMPVETAKPGHSLPYPDLAQPFDRLASPVARQEDRLSFIACQATDSPAEEETAEEATAGKFVIEAGEGQYQITIDTSEAAHLTQWAREELAPVVQQWYPRIVELLPSDNFNAPRTISITFTPEYRGVAAASGTRI